MFFQQQLLCVFFVLLFPQLQEPLVDAEFKTFAKSLGSRTVQSGSVSIGKNDPSQSLQMIERALLTPDELKSLPKGSFVVMKTGSHPMKVKLKLFFQWGIVFPQDIYTVQDKGNRKASYAKREILEARLSDKHIALISHMVNSQANSTFNHENIDSRLKPILYPKPQYKI